jgi:hypothetical protein
VILIIKLITSGTWRFSILRPISTEEKNQSTKKLDLTQLLDTRYPNFQTMNLIKSMSSIKCRISFLLSQKNQSMKLILQIPQLK